MRKGVILGVLISILILGGYLYLNGGEDTVSYSAVNSIVSKMDGRNRLIDLDREICVSSIDDIGFTCKDDVVTVYYGKIQIEITKALMKDSKFMEALKKTGIEIKMNKEKEYVILYWGERVEKWVS